MIYQEISIWLGVIGSIMIGAAIFFSKKYPSKNPAPTVSGIVENGKIRLIVKNNTKKYFENVDILNSDIFSKLIIAWPFDLHKAIKAGISELLIRNIDIWYVRNRANCIEPISYTYMENGCAKTYDFHPVVVPSSTHPLGAQLKDYYLHLDYHLTSTFKIKKLYPRSEINFEIQFTEQKNNVQQKSTIYAAQ